MLTLFSTKKWILEHSGHNSLFDLFFPKVNLAFKKWTKKMSKIEKTKWTFKNLKNLKPWDFGALFWTQTTIFNDHYAHII